MISSLLTLATALAQTPGGPSSGDHSMMVIWGIVLIFAGIVLFMVEIFVPSGGLVGLAATAAAITGIVLLFRVDTTFGLLGAIAALAALPFALAAAIKLWPDSPLGRLLILQTPTRKSYKANEPTPTQATAGQRTGLVVGAVGRALTNLRPVGTVIFDGKREVCLAVGGVIDAGTTVRVVNVDGMQIKVKPVKK